MTPTPAASDSRRRARIALSIALVPLVLTSLALLARVTDVPPEPVLVEAPPSFSGWLNGPSLAPDEPPESLVGLVATDRACEAIGRKLGSVSKQDCLDLELTPSGVESIEGTPILVKEYPPSPGRKAIGRVLLVGGIHGDEYSAISIVFKWLEQLDVHHSGLFHWRTTPLLNPDGLLRERPRRTNGRGVDLNRNFPSPDWESDALAHWIERTGSDKRKYPGPEALSEPESCWLESEIRTFRPDAIVTVHAPLHTLDYDGPPDAPAQLGSLHLDQIGTYPGSLGRYAGEHLGIPVLTLELPSAGALPQPAEQQRIWSDLIDYLRDNIPLQREYRQTRSEPPGSRDDNPTLVSP